MARHQIHFNFLPVDFMETRNQAVKDAPGSAFHQEHTSERRDAAAEYVTQTTSVREVCYVKLTL